MGSVPQDRKGRLNFRASWAERVTLKVQPLQEHEDWEDRDRQKADMACMGVRMEHIRRERSHKGVVQHGRMQMGGERGIGHGTVGVRNRIRHRISNVLGGCLEEKFKSLLIGWTG